MFYRYKIKILRLVVLETQLLYNLVECRSSGYSVVQSGPFFTTIKIYRKYHPKLISLPLKVMF